jgi:hypothetical protein
LQGYSLFAVVIIGKDLRIRMSYLSVGEGIFRLHPAYHLETLFFHIGPAFRKRMEMASLLPERLKRNAFQLGDFSDSKECR